MIKNFLDTLSFRNFRKHAMRITNDRLDQRSINRGLVDYIIELEKQIVDLQRQIRELKGEKKGESDG